MTRVRSAGILLWRRHGSSVQVFIAHMGGPFWSRKDAAAWSIPKGEPETGETDLAAALREFREEIGRDAPPATYDLLGEFVQSSSKVVVVFSAEWNGEVAFVGSNLFQTQWPPRSGRMMEFPEMDDAGWHDVDAAREKLVKGQVPVINALADRLCDGVG